MATGIGPIAAAMSLAAPDEGSRLTIPALDRVGQPVFEDLNIIDMMALQGSADDDPLHRLSHIEPGASTRRVEEPNPPFMAPRHQIMTVMACQVVQNEEHTQGRQHPIQLLGGGKR